MRRLLLRLLLVPWAIMLATLPVPAAEGPPSNTELADFVSTFMRLTGVRHGYLLMLRDEEDPARVEGIKQNAISDMTAVVEMNGLTIDRYNQIALAVRHDPTLQTRVEEILQQLAASPEEE